MNPAGITAFYGAFDLDTCIAELRPAVGNVVVSARFELTEPLCVLDITQFQKPQVKLGLFERRGAILDDHIIGHEGVMLVDFDVIDVPPLAGMHLGNTVVPHLLAERLP